MERTRTEMSSENYSQLGRLVGFLFWMIVPTVAGSMVSSIATSGIVPDSGSGPLSLLAQILETGSQLAYGAVLLVMAKYQRRYRFAGICLLIPTALNLLSQLLLPDAGTTLMSLFTTLPTIILSMIAIYQECKGHYEVLMPLDSELSEKWNRLWKWNIGLSIAMIVSLILTMITALSQMLPLMMAAAFLTLIVSFVAMIVSLLKLVYLYQTSKLLRGC